MSMCDLEWTKSALYPHFPTYTFVLKGCGMDHIALTYLVNSRRYDLLSHLLYVVGCCTGTTKPETAANNASRMKQRMIPVGMCERVGRIQLRLIFKPPMSKDGSIGGSKRATPC